VTATCLVEADRKGCNDLPLMPTPLGHAIGGLVAATAFRTPPRVAAVCALVAMTPDADLLVGSHRTYTHSIGAVAVVGIIAWLFVRRRGPDSPLGMSLAVAAAYGTHLLLDWLGKDSSSPAGLTALWPFSSRFYISGLDLFREVSRRHWNVDEFVWSNLVTVGWELVLLGPILLLVWLVRRPLSEG
jgi:membrane-bound metal-dependent hydrolase YbcI (DUF457 family)